MKYRLQLINGDMGLDEYEMYQNIPSKEIGITNILNGCSYKQYKEIMNKFKEEMIIMNESLNTTTNRYIFYVDDIPIGEIGIRTTLNDFWINRGSQIFYKIREDKRSKGYGTIMLKMALTECKKLGMKQVRINCNDYNIASKKIIVKNGGMIDIESYQTIEGFSSSYIIKLE